MDLPEKTPIPSDIGFERKLFQGVEYLSLAEAVKMTPYSQEYLSLLARTGKIDARKLGRNWYITSAAVLDYITSHQVVMSSSPSSLEDAKTLDLKTNRPSRRLPVFAVAIVSFVFLWSGLFFTSVGENMNRSVVERIPAISQTASIWSAISDAWHWVVDVFTPDPVAPIVIVTTSPGIPGGGSGGFSRRHRSPRS